MSNDPLKVRLLDLQAKLESKIANLDFRLSAMEERLRQLQEDTNEAQKGKKERALKRAITRSRWGAERAIHCSGSTSSDPLSRAFPNRL